MIPTINTETRVVTISNFPTPKKITATRLAGLLGLNKYSTPFKTWTDINRMSFEDLRDNSYLAAGKLLEPRIIAYLQTLEKDIVTPTELYGKMVRDAFSDDPIFGGIPDVYKAPNQKIEEVIEIKTTSNLAQWVEGPPPHYFVQAAFYAAKHGVDKFRIVALYIGDYDIADLDALRQIRPSKANVLTFQFTVSQDAKEIFSQLETARQWWKDHAVTGISPPYDEVRDWSAVEDIKGYLTRFADSELQDSAERLNFLINRQDMLMKLAKDNESEIKTLNKLLKVAREGGLIPAIYGGLKMELTPTSRATVNKEALKADGLFEKYMTTTHSNTFKVVLSKVMLDTTSFTALMLKYTGEVVIRQLRIINQSISEGLYYALSGVYDVIETPTYVLAYVSIEDSAHSQIFQIGELNVFGRCLVYRRDLRDISTEDEYGNFMNEFNALYQSELDSDETTEFGGV